MRIWVLITQLPSDEGIHQEEWAVLLKKYVETAHTGKIPPAGISSQLGLGLGNFDQPA